MHLTVMVTLLTRPGRHRRSKSELPAPIEQSNLAAYRCALSICGPTVHTRGMDDAILDSSTPAESVGQASDPGVLRELSARFRSEQEGRAAKVRRELAEQGAAQLLTRLAAEEAALVAKVLELETQLVARACLLVDSPSHVSTIAATMKILRSAHDGLAGRVQGFLLAAEALTAAATSARPAPLRRVA